MTFQAGKGAAGKYVLTKERLNQERRQHGIQVTVDPTQNIKEKYQESSWTAGPEGNKLSKSRMPGSRSASYGHCKR